MTRAFILDGAARLRDLADAAVTALRPRLQARGHEVTRRDLTALSIPDCNGDFGCWTVTPGICVQPGPHRELAREIIQSDLVVLLGPVTFGGYASPLKRTLDHAIPLSTPWFNRVDGETHHRPRYPRFPALLAVGLEEDADPAAEAVFERLVRRNALNLRPRAHAAGFLTRAGAAAADAAAERWLATLEASTPPRARAAPLDLSARPDLPVRPARRALLLTGTPRGEAAVSTGLARHLEGLLTARGLEVETLRLQACLREDRALRGLAARVRASDAVALLTPLYVDGLPGPVTEALEALAAERPADPSRPPRLLAVLNCGFPEPVHDDTALAICRRFAAQAGLEWMGGLAIGGGGMYQGRPLTAQGGRARHLLAALDLAAGAIAGGTALPAEAERLARQLPVPAWLYRRMGDLGFWRERRRRGTLSWREPRPYA